MAGKSKRDQVVFACTICKRRNYTSTKNKKNTPGRMEKKKYCKWDKKHTVHKETK
ncbi:MAG: 50S ribosomal protein L33 [Candidatus Aureabacteria bacterium]|nr:50S ribosomal protein L33 [Candidatus Auribacterota bacterium]